MKHVVRCPRKSVLSRERKKNCEGRKIIQKQCQCVGVSPLIYIEKSGKTCMFEFDSVRAYLKGINSLKLSNFSVVF